MAFVMASSRANVVLRSLGRVVSQLAAAFPPPFPGDSRAPCHHCLLGLRDEGLGKPWAHDLSLCVHEPGELVLDEFAKLMHAHTISLPKAACKACTKRALPPRGTSH